MQVWFYNLFFTVGLPVFLAVWAYKTATVFSLPPASTRLAAPLLAGGAVLMTWSIIDFILETKRIPSNASPPSTRAISGPYRIFSDPIYVGASILAFGVAAIAQSGTGFWLVAPSLSLGAIALVFGKEALSRPPLNSENQRSLLTLPNGAEETPTARERLSGVIHVAALIGATETFRFAAWPDIAMDEMWLLGLMVAIAILIVILAPSTWVLRKLLVGAWVAGAVLLLTHAGPSLYSTQWSVLSYGSIALGAFAGAWMERAPVKAFILLVAAAFLAQYAPAHRNVIWLGVLAAGILPVHAISRGVCEAIANSWSAVRIGPFRVINYAVYAFGGAAAGAYIFLGLVGNKGIAASIIITASVVISAGLWGQLVEFSGKLARPFGYYGALIGAFVGVALTSLILDISPWLLGAGIVLGAPLAQALGRLRCLVQGCCHGGTVEEPCRGIVYRKPQSRVLRIANLGGQFVHPTPLYSIYANAVAMVILLRMLASGAPQTLLVGVYLIVSGGLRFIEEAYRGEPQTPIWKGLKLYQWLALAQCMTGIGFTFIPSAPTPAWTWPTTEGLIAAAITGILAGFAMGVDFPTLKKRFSHLTPSDS